MKSLSTFLFYRKWYALLAWVTLSLTGLWCSVSAQSRGTVSFSCVIWKPLPYENVYYKTGREYVPLKLRPNHRSKVHKLSGASTLDLYTSTIDERGKPTYQLIGQGPLLANTKRILFFVIKAKEGSALPYNIWGIEDAMDKFPPGTFHVINFTDQRLAIHFGGKVTGLLPEEMKVVPSKVSSKGGLIPFVVRGRSGEKMYENRFFTQPHGRDVVFIFPKEGRDDRVRLKMVHQLVPPIRKR